MISRRLALLTAAAMLSSFALDVVGAPQAEAKGKKRSNYFVPPPPAYTPSLTPGLYYGGSKTADGTTSKAKTPEQKYQKYVYTREGYTAPKPTQPNPYVTYWGS